MGKKRFSDAMEKALNAQMTREAYQAQVYLALASWAEVNNFAGVAAFLNKHSTEERNHMFKFLKFINERGGHAKIEAIEAPPADPQDVGACLRKALEHEVDNSKAIDAIATQAFEEKDWATFSFAQWFVKEQIEEEVLINEILDKYELASSEKDNNTSLYELDRNVAGLPQHAEIPRDTTLD